MPYCRFGCAIQHCHGHDNLQSYCHFKRHSHSLEHNQSLNKYGIHLHKFYLSLNLNGTNVSWVQRLQMVTHTMERVPTYNTNAIRNDNKFNSCFDLWNINKVYVLPEVFYCRLHCPSHAALAEQQGLGQEHDAVAVVWNCQECFLLAIFELLIKGDS